MLNLPKAQVFSPDLPHIIFVPVPPNKIAITGVGEHATQGTLLTLMCAVSGARPPATIRWFNGTQNLTDDEYNIHVSIVKSLL